MDDILSLKKPPSESDFLETWKLEETWLNLRKVIFLTSIEDLKTDETKNDEISTTSIEESLDHPQDPTT